MNKDYNETYANRCIIIPIYKQLTEEETASLINLDNKLPRTHKYVVMPKSLKIDLSLEVYSERILDDKHFSGLISYSRLLYSSWFWDLFKEYDYALIHQPDCWLYGDEHELDFWCKQNYCFIGAPHFKNYNYEMHPDVFQDTMNGGLSLRDIKSSIQALKVLEGNGFKVDNCSAHEDVFWIELFKHMKGHLPNPRIAAAFAIEQGHEVIYPLLSPYKPFGLHAYVKYNSRR